MKYLLILIMFLTFSGSIPGVLHAQTPTSEAETTPSTAPTKKMQSDSLTAQITNLKEKIASRVAELKLVEKRGIVGIVSEVKDTQISLTDHKGNIRHVDVDELTKFLGSDSKSTLGISDIKKGMKISVLGRYNKQTERILARFVEEVSFPEFVSGVIKDVDATNFAFSIAGANGKIIDIDVENVTKTQSYSKEDGLVRAGFSKLLTGDQVVITGFPDKNNPKRIVATRVLILTDFRKVDPASTETSTTPAKTTLKTATPTP
jgi:hypothetical protein